MTKGPVWSNRRINFDWGKKCDCPVCQDTVAVVPQFCMLQYLGLKKGCVSSNTVYKQSYSGCDVQVSSVHSSDI